MEVGDNVTGFDGAIDGDEEAGIDVAGVEVGDSVKGFEGAVEGDDEAGATV